MPDIDIDERIRSALHARAQQVTEADLAPSSVPAPDEPHHIPSASRWTGRWFPPLLAAAAVIAVSAGTVAMVSVVRSDHDRPAHGPTAPAPTATSPAPNPQAPTSFPAHPAPTSHPGPASATNPPSSTSPPTSAGSSAAQPPGSGSFQLGYQPLWPFQTLAQAQEWQQSNRSGGHQPWHADPALTALAFTRGYLGFTEITIVTSQRIDASGAHIGVGYRNPNGAARTAAVLHLVRFGADPDSPWEVVGSDDTTFTLDTPAYGSIAASPVTVGGQITGVDENIRVSVRQLSSSALIGTNCCTPAGTGPWDATVTFQGATSPTLTIVASTGGHIQQVERFAIQGVRTG